MINCTITSSQKTTIYKNVRSIMLPAFSGRMQVLPGHAESFLLLNEGNIIFQQSRRKKETVQILGGECYIKDNLMVIIL